MNKMIKDINHEYNLETLKAIKESEDILTNPSKYKSYSSAEEMVKDIVESEGLSNEEH